MVGIQHPDLKDSELTYISPDGGIVPAPLRGVAIGTGARLAEYFLKKLSTNKKLNMRQFAALGWFIIKHIEDNQLDPTVGINGEAPQIYFLENKGQIDTSPNNKGRESLLKKSKKMRISFLKSMKS